jgi:hypothetical protein
MFMDYVITITNARFPEYRRSICMYILILRINVKNYFRQMLDRRSLPDSGSPVACAGQANRNSSPHETGYNPFFAPIRLLYYREIVVMQTAISITIPAIS